MYNTNLISLTLCALLSLSTSGQVKLERLNASLDYNTGIQTLLDNEKGYGLTGSLEYALSDNFSAELLYYRDRDNYLGFAFDAGLPAADYNRSYKYSYWTDEAAVMARFYPAEQYHSRSQALRHKVTSGFYFSYGFAVLQYNRVNVNIETFRSAVVDSTGQPVYAYDSIFHHYHGYKIRMHGSQFGFGIKQHHSKWGYTDVKLMSSAYFDRTKKLSIWYREDPQRGNPNPYYPEVDRANYERFIETLSRNGRGLVLTVSVGINIDPR